MDTKLLVVQNESASEDEVMNALRRSSQFAHKHVVTKVTVLMQFMTDDGHISSMKISDRD